jgi:hypothetical protein
MVFIVGYILPGRAHLKFGTAVLISLSEMLRMDAKLLSLSA